MAGKPDPGRRTGELEQLAATALGWLAAGHRAAIATVIRTWGSAPRRTGSHLVIRDDGRFEGSVSGGCVEGEVITAASEVIGENGFRRLDFGVADATAWEVGLACGGQISVLVQALTPARFPPELLARLAEAQRRGEMLELETDLATGATRQAGPHPGGDERFVNSYAPPLRLAIVGAVHIAQALAPIAIGLGYDTTVVDPRGLFGTADRFAGIELVQRWPDEALADWRPTAASAVVALSHDPKLDDVALAAALRSPAFYVAALGSRRSHAARLERLAALGFGAGELDRIHGPAGLPIGAANPPEIALSIAAQMVAAWRQGTAVSEAARAA